MSDPSVHTPEGMTKHSVATEDWREYVFKDAEYRICKPITLYVKRKAEGDSHRVVDASGVVHYVPAGWIALRWKNNPGAGEVAF